MFDFSDFCKSKKCKYYREIQMQVGLCRTCALIGVHFTITKFPYNCVHLKEIIALRDSEKEKAETWKKLTDVRTSSEKFADRFNKWGGLLKKYTKDDIL